MFTQQTPKENIRCPAGWVSHVIPFSSIIEKALLPGEDNRMRVEGRGFSLSGGWSFTSVGTLAPLLRLRGGDVSDSSSLLSLCTSHCLSASSFAGSTPAWRRRSSGCSSFRQLPLDSAGGK